MILSNLYASSVVLPASRCGAGAEIWSTKCCADSYRRRTLGTSSSGTAQIPLLEPRPFKVMLTLPFQPSCLYLFAFLACRRQ